MNQTLKRVLSLVLALAMCISMVPGIGMIAKAAEGDVSPDTLVEGLGATYTPANGTNGKNLGTVTWKAEKDSLSGAVTINYSVLGYTPNGRAYTAESTQLTLTNNLDVEAVLTFDYEIAIAVANKDTVSIDGVSYASGKGAYEMTMAPGESLVIALGAAQRSGAANGASIKMTNVRLGANPTVETTFLAAQNGSYSVTYNETTKEITEDTKISNTATTNYTLTATPDEGYSFAGWYNQTTGLYVGSGATSKNVRFDEPCSIVPLFIKTNDAIYRVGEAYFTDLAIAASYANNASDKVIVLLKDAALTSGSYTIPADVTLLIPFDEDNTLYEETPGCTSSDKNNVAWETPYVYRTLTMENGATLTVKGAISIGSKHAAGGAQTAGSPTGAYGHIAMNAGSNITVENGGKLYAWGYITGEGTITANPGAKVYENLQVTDFRGGNASASMVPAGNDDLLINEKKVFPFSQYYVQNIEVALTLYSGAFEYVYTSIYALDQANSILIDFIGTESSMFYIGEGSYVVKDYDPTTDRLTLSANGTGEIEVNGLSLTLAGMTVSSDMFDLPITSNITINVNGGSATINQDVALLPGSEVNIAKGASMTVNSGNNVFVYDTVEWDQGYRNIYDKSMNGGLGGYYLEETMTKGCNFVYNNCKVRPVSFSPSGKVSRTADSLVDAKVDVNGTLYIDGYLYTTESGANITSSEGTGVIWMNSGAGDRTYTNQVIQNNIDVTFVNVMVTSAQLKNADGSYTATADAAEGCGYGFNEEEGVWLDHVTVSFDGNGAAGETESQMVAYEDIYWAVLFDDPEWAAVTLPDSTFTAPAGATFSGWNTKADGTGDGYVAGDLFAVTENVTLYAQWDVEMHTLSFVDEEGNAVLDPVEVEYGASYTLPEVPAKTGMEGCWMVDGVSYAGGDTVENITTDMKFVATYIAKYNLYFDANGGYFGTDPANKQISTELAYGAVINEIGQPVREGYEFTGWNTKADGTGTELVSGVTTISGDITYYAQWEVVTYTVTYDSNHEGFGFYIFADSTLLDAYTVTEESGATHTVIQHGSEEYRLEWNAEDVVFAGWNTKADGTGTAYQPGDEITVTGDLTLYAQYAKVAVGDVTLNDGEYVDLEGKVTTTMPTGGYAYYNNGTLTLNNYSYSGKGYAYQFKPQINASIYTSLDNLTIVLAGENSIVNTFGGGEGIYVYEDLTIQGEGSLSVTAYTGIGGDNLTIESGTFTINGGIFFYETVTIKGGSVHVLKGGIDTWEGITLAENLIIKTPVGGKISENGTYIVDSNGSYAEEVLIAAPSTYNVTFSGTNVTSNGAATATDGGDYTATLTAAEGYNLPATVTVTIGGEAYTGYTYDYEKGVVTIPAADITGNIEITAVGVIKTYTITWKNDDGSVIDTTTVDHGATPTHADPTKTGDAQYSYTFAGWTPAVVAAKADATYTATYNKTVNKYTIKFVNEDGSVLQEETLVYGTMPEYKGAIPTKAADAQYTYSFKGWDKEVVAVTGEATYTATYDKTVNKYTVIFLNEDGTDLQVETLEYGTMPVYKGATPTKTGNAQYSYSFAGWDPAVKAVTGDVTYTATYTATVNEYTIKFVNDDGTVLQETKVAYGSMPKYEGATPTKTGDAQYTYTFAGWDNGITAVTGEATYTATYDKTVNEYTIKFVNDDGTVLQSGKVAYGTVPEYKGATPTKAATAQYTYTFADWDKEVVAVTGEATYTATYTATVNEYTIKFVNDDGTVLQETKVAYGETPAYTGETPTKAATAQYTYTFADWDKEVVAVTGEATYTATYTATVNKYTITWVIDGEETTTEVEYGTMPEAPEATKAADDQFTYTFAGWTPEIVEVTGEATYTAVFTKTGWVTDEYGTSYIVEDEVAFKNQVAEVEGETYFFDEAGYIVANKGLVRTVTGEGVVEYYYFGCNNNGCKIEDCKADVYTARKDCVHWVEITNGLELPKNDYTFDENGVIVHNADTSLNGIHADEDGVDCYYIDGVKAYMGLIEIDGAYYYVRTNGELVKNKTYWITKTNGLKKEGSYTFDEEGKMVLEISPATKTGIFAEGGSLYYYKDGKRTYAGLIEIDGAYYYVKSNCEVVHGGIFWITKTNDLMAQGNYNFDETGKMIPMPEEEPKFTGIQDGYYYKDGQKYYAGLIEIDGFYYYVNSSCKVITGQTYWISKTNDLMKEGSYTFDAQGRMVIGNHPDVKNGLYTEGDKIYYYEDGVKTYAGLIEIDGYLYYIKSDCSAVKDGIFWITKTNGILPQGRYTFDAQGRMVTE